jgi:hypothetical protein
MIEYTFDLNDRNLQLEWSKLEFGGGKVWGRSLADLTERLICLTLMISSSYLQTCFNLILVAAFRKLIFARIRLGAIKLQLNHDGHVTSQKVNFSSFDR